MKFKDIKLRTLLIITIVTELSLVVSMGIISYYLNRQIHEQTHIISENALPTRKSIGIILGCIEMMRIETRDLILASNTDEQRSITESIVRNANFADIEFRNIYKTYLGTTFDIDEAYRAFRTWRNARSVNMERARKKKIEEFKESVSPTGHIGKLRIDLLNKIDILTNETHKTSENANIKSDFYKKTLATVQTIHISLMIILSFIFLIIFLKYFRRPLIDLTKVMSKFDKGDLSARSSFIGQNEIGELAQSFNHLSENLQFASELNMKTELLADLMLIEDDLKGFFNITLKVLMQDTDSEMAAVYLLNEDKTTFYHLLSFGVADQARESFSASLMEGEFGHVIVNKRIHHFKNIPDDTRFLFKTTGGNIIPKEIITIPILSSNEVIAIISLVNIHSFSELAIQLVNKIHLTYCVRVDKLLAYEKIKTYSNSLSLQNKELEEQKRELYKQSDELTEQNRELEIQKKMLDEANRHKTVFLSNMSHELRTPLNSVIALSGVLSRRLINTISEEEINYLNVIERNGRDLLLLINNILDISKIESGRDELIQTEFNLCKEIEDIIEMIKPQLIEKDVQLNVSGDCDIIIFSDKTKVRHIFQNLIDNSIKFTEKGSISLHVQKLIDEVSIVVKDTGIGINKKSIPYIFDEFRQADESTSRKYGGTGLGLSIVKKYAELIGGKVSVESTPGEGSSFIVVLPLSTNYSYVPEQKHTNFDINRHRKINESATILLIEDNEPSVIQISDYLENTGFMIVTAKNATEGLNTLNSIIPDAIILDLMMPDIDGFEVLQKIRNDERSSNVPVLVLTAKHIAREELKLLKQNHIYQLIQKGDVKREELLRILKEMTESEDNL